MDSNKVVEKLLPHIKRYWIPLALAFLGIVFIGYGAVALLGSSSGQESQVVFTEDASAKKETKITVDVEGAVLKPGVYDIIADARIKDALAAAGGLSQEADRVWISKNLNLAAKLTDSAKLYIPTTGESATQASSGVKDASSAGSSGVVVGSSGSVTSSGLININSATAKELDTLPGVGAVTAEKIINGRPYASIQELLDRKIVSSRVFGEIKEKTAVY